MCKSVGSDEDWGELGRACLVHMEVELAIQVYRMSKNVGMVMSLQKIQVHLHVCLNVTLIPDNSSYFF